MAKGDKLTGAMSKGPSKEALTRVSPGVYRNPAGDLVGSKGQALQQRGGFNEAGRQALQQMQGPRPTDLGVPMPRGGQQMQPPPGNMPPMQTQPLIMGNNPAGTAGNPAQMVAGARPPQPTQQQFDQQLYNSMRQSKDKGLLSVMGRPQEQRMQQFQQNVAGGQDVEEAAQQQGLQGFGMRGTSPAEQGQARMAMLQAQLQNMRFRPQ